MSSKVIYDPEWHSRSGRKDDIKNALREIIDKSSLEEVVSLLADICYENDRRCLANDPPQFDDAKSWRNDGDTLERAYNLLRLPF